MKKHPMQYTHRAKDGVFRFVENKIISELVDADDLNRIALKYHGTEDYAQLMMLIGYSVSGAPSAITGDDRELTQQSYDPKTFNSWGEDEYKTISSKTEAKYYENKYTSLKLNLAPIIADLYNKHIDDLIED